MTRKDYEAIATCIGGAMADSRNSVETLMDVSRRLNVVFQNDNPRYSVDKFFGRIYFWVGKYQA